MAEFWNPYAALSSRQRQVLGFGAVIGVLAVWALLAASGTISQNKLPAPWQVLKAMGYLAWNDGHSQLLTATLWSVGRVAVAGVLVVSIGIPTGILMGASPRIN